MSNTTIRAFQEVQKTKFNFINPHTIEVCDAHIFWTNFSATPNRFGSRACTFNLAITEDLAAELESSGWRVRSVDNDDGSVLYFVNIKVNMESAYPPIVSVFSEFRGKRGKRTLDAETIGELDKINIQSCDMLINAYESRQFEGKVTGYLKKLNVIQEPNIEFGGKYDDWLEEGISESPVADEELPFDN